MQTRTFSVMSCTRVKKSEYALHVDHINNERQNARHYSIILLASKQRFRIMTLKGSHAY